MTNGDSGSRFNYKTNGNRGVLLIGPRGSTWHTQGPQEGVKQRVERERESGQMLYRGLWVKCFRAPWLRLDWSIQTKREGVPRVLSKGYPGNIL